MEGPRSAHERALLGCLLGTAVGDAVGLPAEGLSRARIARRWPGPWRHRLLVGRGMLSDDTEHTVFVAQALLASGCEPVAFERRLAWSLRWWLASLPAGTGLATARAVAGLWLGASPGRSAVPSAGNGPAMRSALFGVALGNEAGLRASLVARSCRLTHSDPRALAGALAMAEAAAWAAHGGESGLAGLVARLVDGTPFAELDGCAWRAPQEWRACMARLDDALQRGLEVEAFCGELGLERGVSGFVLHSVPVALYAALRHRDDPRRGLEEVWRAGGDTDTVGAMAGALLGTLHGEQGLPRPWVEGILDWPRSVGTLRRLARALAAPREDWRPVRYPALGSVLRNPLFLAVVLGHGARRLLPP